MEQARRHMAPVVEVPVVRAELPQGVDTHDGHLLHPTSALLHLLPGEGSQVLLRGRAADEPDEPDGPDDPDDRRAQRWTMWLEPLPATLALRLAEAVEATAEQLDHDADRLRGAAEILMELGAIPCDVV